MCPSHAGWSPNPAHRLLCRLYERARRDTGLTLVFCLDEPEGGRTDFCSDSGRGGGPSFREDYRRMFPRTDGHVRGPSGDCPLRRCALQAVGRGRCCRSVLVVGGRGNCDGGAEGDPLSLLDPENYPERPSSVQPTSSRVAGADPRLGRVPGLSLAGHGPSPRSLGLVRRDERLE